MHRGLTWALAMLDATARNRGLEVAMPRVCAAMLRCVCVSTRSLGRGFHGPAISPQHIPEGFPGGETCTPKWKADSQTLGEVLDPNAQRKVPGSKKKKAAEVGGGRYESLRVRSWKTHSHWLERAQ